MLTPKSRFLRVLLPAHLRGSSEKHSADTGMYGYEDRRFAAASPRTPAWLTVLLNVCAQGDLPKIARSSHHNSSIQVR